MTSEQSNQDLTHIHVYKQAIIILFIYVPFIEFLIISRNVLSAGSETLQITYFHQKLHHIP